MHIELRLYVLIYYLYKNISLTDQVGVKGVWSIEANEEQMKIINSKSYYLDLNCMNIKVSTNEAIQSLYSLTRVLDVDANKLTDPVF